MIKAAEANKIMQAVKPDNLLDAAMNDLNDKIKARAGNGEYYFLQPVTGRLAIVEGEFSFKPNENSRALAGRLIDLGYKVSFCLDGDVVYKCSDMPIQDASGYLMISWFDC